MPQKEGDPPEARGPSVRRRARYRLRVAVFAADTIHIAMSTSVAQPTPRPVTIPLGPARSESSARMELTTGLRKDAAAWPVDPRTIEEAVITIAAVGYFAEHVGKPDALIVGLLVWLVLRQMRSS